MGLWEQVGGGWWPQGLACGLCFLGFSGLVMGALALSSSSISSAAREREARWAEASKEAWWSWQVGHKGRDQAVQVSG